MAFRDVKAYGAQGDGSTNDTAAIQSCLDAAISGDEIYFPAGQYAIGAAHVHLAIPSKNLRLVGDGPEASKLLGAFPGDGNASGASILMGVAQGLEVAHLSLRAKVGAGFQCGMRVSTGSSGVRFTDVVIDGCGMGSQLTTIVAGVWLSGGVQGFSFVDGSITSVGQSTNESAFILVATGPAQSSDIIIARNTMAGRANEKPSVGILIFDARRSLICDNTISAVGHFTSTPNASGYGIAVYQYTTGLSSEAEVARNNIDGTDGSGIYMPGCRGAHVHRNRIRNAALVQDNGTLLVGGIAVGGSGKIEHNDVDVVGGGGQPNPPCGIVAQSTFGGQLDVENNASGHAYAGLQLRSPCSGVRHAGRGNAYHDCQVEIDTR